ncbi:DUF3396 domain-containing protein [Stigmatella aurantiaca]|uniref:Conserved uncharacterized protein n=1 Tax=Stigmatella aurantiaca (strain DW4/3-1) TaxID=378806 RepID=E3FDU3_STIAD|nr:DUF3396 domain-containing protein [Stigmatella aurantiaca]ADO71358.1 conserved uncharacterized protein [Stigmatella aurantiaca DW4/3-1]
MSEHYPRIRLMAKNGSLVVREGLSLTFFMRHTHMEVAQAVERALEAYLSAIGQGALGWYIDPDGEYQKLDETGWAITRRKLREARGGVIRLYDAPESGEPYRFEYYGKDLLTPSVHDTQNATCVMSCWLPTEFLEKHGPDHVRELALEMAQPLPYCSGYAGLSFNGELDLAGIEQKIAPHCFRHPGIDVPCPESLGWKLGTRFRGPAWLTFLGQPLLGELGGATALRSRLHSPGTTVQEIEGDRALITLGSWPEAGDTTRGDNLPAYRVLESWLFHEPSRLMPCLREEDVQHWERRFLD